MGSGTHKPTRASKRIVYAGKPRYFFKECNERLLCQRVAGVARWNDTIPLTRMPTTTTMRESSNQELRKKKEKT